MKALWVLGIIAIGVIVYLVIRNQQKKSKLDDVGKAYAESYKDYDKTMQNAILYH